MKRLDNTIKFSLDRLFWYILYLLPVIVYFIRGDGVFASFMSAIGFGLDSGNIVMTALSGLFGSLGLLPLFASADILVFCAYFVSVFLVHLSVDFLLFIPRICMKFLGKVTNDED